MKGLLAGFVLALVACGKGDDTADGTRSECAFGGTLTACPEIDRTPEGACWRLVDCAAIPVSSDKQGTFDWGSCVDAIEKAEDPAERLIIDCIAASSCDQLQGPGSPQTPDSSQMPCFMIGGE